MKCAICDRDFEVSPQRRKTCSTPCAAENDRRMRRAKEARRERRIRECEPRRERYRRRRMFGDPALLAILSDPMASAEAKGIALRAIRRAYYRSRIQPRFCHGCGADISHIPYARYCGAGCKPPKPVYPTKKAPTINRHCIHCGDEFTTTYPHVLTCSKLCSEQRKRDWNRERAIVYQQRPDVRARRQSNWQSFIQQPGIAESRLHSAREYRALPDVIEHRREYARRPEVRDRRWELQQQPEYRAKRSAYGKRPDVVERRREQYRKERTVEIAYRELVGYDGRKPYTRRRPDEYPRATDPDRARLRRIVFKAFKQFFEQQEGLS
jgi:hypothetical protein